LDPFEITGSIVLLLILAVSNAAGIGGGGTIIPIFIMFFNFKTSNAIALTNLCVCVSAIARFIFQLNERHPYKDAVVIDYEIVMVMLPATLLGALVGV